MASGPKLVKNVRSGEFTKAGALILFTGCDSVHGCELWRTDGTRQGTTLVKDINPGSPGSKPHELTAFDGKVLFAADDGTHGRELWRSDGTAAGTRLVKDIDPIRIAATDSTYGSNPYNLVKLGGQVFFVANNSSCNCRVEGPGGAELWRSDGKAAGTQMVADINPGIASSNPEFLTPSAGKLYFSADDATHGNELWSSDGTQTGTALVDDIHPGAGSSDPFELTNVGGKVYFGADDGTHGSELWSSPPPPISPFGRAGMVRDINSGPGGSGPDNFAAFNGGVAFSAEDPASGRELWQSDGTAAGTTVGATLYPGPTGSDPMNPVVAGRALFFDADDPTHGIELHTLDDNGRTHLVADINPGTADSWPAYQTFAGKNVVFSASDGTHGYELWQTSAEGRHPRMVADIDPGMAGSNPAGLTAIGGTVYFGAHDVVHRWALWTYTP
jgi:ELWxxDGT repeat protein